MNFDSSAFHLNSKRPHGAPRKFAFEIDVALIACNQFRQHAAYALMGATKLNHCQCCERSHT